MMRIGVITTELPPMQGGMPEFSRGLVRALAATDEIHVHTRPGLRLDLPSVPVHETLGGRLWLDSPALLAAEPRVDAWLGLNAGLAPLAASLERPFFLYVHGNDLLNPWLACGPRWLESIRRPYAARVRRALRCRAIRRHTPALRHLLANSRQTATLACEHLGLGPDRISIIPPGVRDAFFQDQEPEKDPEVLRLLTVSRLSRHTRRKNVDGVLRAIARLGDTFAIRYTVIGDGDDRQRLEVVAQDLGLGDRVDFLGSVDTEQLLLTYRRTDLFILASRATERDVEGFGIVYLEANASGVPVICSREGGATDAVVDGHNGLLIDRSSPEVIAEGIERFVRERARFEADTVRDFAEEFRWPKIADRVRAVIDKHLSYLPRKNSLG